MDMLGETRGEFGDVVGGWCECTPHPRIRDAAGPDLGGRPTARTVIGPAIVRHHPCAMIGSALDKEDVIVLVGRAPADLRAQCDECRVVGVAPPLVESHVDGTLRYCRPAAPSTGEILHDGRNAICIEPGRRVHLRAVAVCHVCAIDDQPRLAGCSSMLPLFDPLLALVRLRPSPR